jgi:hypothetical protein
VRRTARWLRGSRVTLPQLALISAVSAVVSAMIVVSALGETGPERAVIAALHTRRVIHAVLPAAAPAHTTTSAAAPAVDAPSSPAPAAASPPAASTGSDAASGSGTAAGASSDSTSGTDSSSGSGTSSGNGNSDKQPTKPASHVKHVFVIVLGTPSYSAAFGHGSAASYLNSKLRPQGELLSNYRTLSASPLPDYIAMVSGQAPNHDTTQDCPTYSEFPGSASPAGNGLVPGTGCVYPNTALTVGDQLDSANLPWRAYIEGMTAPCQHPNSGAADNTGTSEYATSHNPFVYFHSLLDLGDCQSDDVPYTRLANALGSAHRTPSYSFISPDVCDSGIGVTCPEGQPGGIAMADGFLKRTVPSILSSPAYRSDGALLILFTAAPGTAATPSRPVRTGALVLSPYTHPGSTDASKYDAYSVLRSIENVFGLPALAKAKTATAFDSKVFSSSRH